MSLIGIASPSKARPKKISGSLFLRYLEDLNAGFLSLTDDVPVGLIVSFGETVSTVFAGKP